MRAYMVAALVAKLLAVSLTKNPKNLWGKRCFFRTHTLYGGRVGGGGGALCRLAASFAPVGGVWAWLGILSTQTQTRQDGANKRLKTAYAAEGWQGVARCAAFVGGCVVVYSKTPQGLATAAKVGGVVYSKTTAAGCFWVIVKAGGCYCINMHNCGIIEYNIIYSNNHTVGVPNCGGRVFMQKMRGGAVVVRALFSRAVVVGLSFGRVVKYIIYTRVMFGRFGGV